MATGQRESRKMVNISNSCTRQRRQGFPSWIFSASSIFISMNNIIFSFIRVPLLEGQQRAGPGVDTRPNGTRYPRISSNTCAPCEIRCPLSISNTCTSGTEISAIPEGKDDERIFISSRNRCRIYLSFF